MKTLKIIVAGGTGFVGTAVVKRILAKGHQVFVLSRSSRPVQPTSTLSAGIVYWDRETQGEWCSILENADAVINFSGENISGRAWSKEYKEKLINSRLGSTHLIVKAIASCRKPPRVLINASAVGYYGDSADHLLYEGSSRGAGFLADLCVSWERAAFEAKSYDVRVIVARMGIVIGSGGVLNKFLPSFRSFLGGPLGSGRQWMSWISTDDLAEAILFMIIKEDLQGPVNCVSPQPVTMNEFCRELGSILHRPSGLRCPSCVLRLILGEMADVVLSSQRVVPQKLLSAEFRFRQPLLRDALSRILNKL